MHETRVLDARLRREVRHLQFSVQRTLQRTSRTTCTTFLFTKKYANFDRDLQNVQNVQIFTKMNELINVRNVRGHRSVERTCYRG